MGFSNNPASELFTNKFLHVSINNKIIFINRKEYKGTVRIGNLFIKECTVQYDISESKKYTLSITKKKKYTL
jgi:hypothetical protein